MPRDPRLIAGRYQLVERLGTGAMGEVWRARDLKFDNRVVAVKLLKEDQTHREDADNRERLQRALRQEASDGQISATLAASLLDEVLRSGKNEDVLRARVTKEADANGRLAIDAVLQLFDALVQDATYCESARFRAKLRRLFRDEANSVANLRHDNIVSISDYGDHEGTPFLAMDHIEGQTLLRLIQRGDRLDRSFQLRLMEDLCKGLAYAHRRNLVHRDIKPANLIVETGTQSLKILDFGVVRHTHDHGESTIGLPLGTLCYMSPEQIQGGQPVDHRSDVFAVGVVFYELLTGQKAFPPGQGITDLMFRIRQVPPPDLTALVPDIEADVQRILGRALEKDPARRYQDLEEMGRDLARARAQLESRRPGETDDGHGDDTLQMRKVGQEAPIPRLLRRGERALEVGEPAAALEAVRQILAYDPHHAAALALQERARALERDRKLSTGIAQVSALLEAGDLSNARLTLESLRAMDPNANAIRALTSRLDNAEAALRQARLRDAQVREGLEKARSAYEEGALETAIQLVHQVQALDPVNNDAAGLLERAERRLSERRAAQVREAERRKRIDEAFEHGAAAMRTRHFDRAVEIFSEAAEIAPERDDIRARLTEAEKERDEERAKQQTEKQVASLVGHANDLAAAGDVEAALALLEGDQTLHPTVAARLQALQVEKQKKEQKRAQQAEEDRKRREREEERKRKEREEAERAATAKRSAAAAPTAPRPSPQPAPPQPLAIDVALPDVRPSWRPAKPALLAGAGALAAAVILGVYLMRPGEEPAAEPIAPPPVAVTDANTVAPPVTPSSVAVDFRPWARVRIVGVGGATAPPDEFVTPFVVALPPGRYRLEGENGGLTKPDAVEIDVVSGQILSVSRDMPGFNPEQVIDQVLGR